MAAILKQEQAGPNRWYTWIEISASESLMLITSAQVSEDDALEIQARHRDAHLYDDTPQILASPYEQKDVLREAVLFIRQNTPTATQWNNYLKTLAWYDAYMVRYVLAVLAMKLAERGEVVITDFTETEVLTRLRTFLSAAPLRRLEKIVFGE